MTYNSLIFDLDGTLTDPLTGILRCMNYALSSHGHQVVSESAVKPFIGPPLEIGLSQLSGIDDEAHIKELVATYRERYGELGFAENVVYDGIEDLLGTLVGKDFRLGVCTSKFEKYAIKVLEKFELDRYFDFVIGSSAPGMTKADQLQKLIDTGVAETNSLMIGDRDIDLISAQQVGMFGAGVLWGYGSREELSANGPVFLAETPEQLGSTIINED